MKRCNKKEKSQTFTFFLYTNSEKYTQTGNKCLHVTTKNPAKSLLKQTMKIQT
ncbi:hypothetical protein HORM4_670052 [Vibrio harveyi]|nr:hypothetical protein HORM4_670052 [Vibrio harveyi]